MPLTLEPRKPPKSSPFAPGFGRGIKGKRTTKGSSIQPPPNPKEKGLEIAPRKSPRKGSENHQKGEIGKTHQALRNHAESSSLSPIILPFYKISP
jgi:hypothetical protein